MLGCFLAAAGTIVLGMIWYSDKLPMGRVWMKRIHPGKTFDEIGGSVRPYLGITMVSSILLCLLLRFVLVDFFHVKTILDAVKFTVGLSCLSTLIQLPHRLFSAGSVDAFIIDQVYDFLSLTLAGVCIAYF